jgi:hypothetical protein
MIWDYKRGDNTLKRQQMFDTNWETLINDEPDVNNACSNFTNVFLTIAKECIPTREVTIRTDDKMWFDSNLHRESRRRDRLRKTFLRTKTVSAKKHYKKQRNRVNNLKKQAKELFYANINENLDELKTTDSKMYWKTIHMLIKNERSANTMPPLRDRDNNLNLSYDCFDKADILNTHFCSIYISDLNDKNKDLPPCFEVRCKHIL